MMLILLLLIFAGTGHIKQPFERLNQFTGQRELFDPHAIFSSPSIRYSSHRAYAPAFTVSTDASLGKESKKKDKGGGDSKVELQVAFQLRQEPGSYGIGQETVGATRRGEVLDPLIGNEQLEYYTQQRVGILLHGQLVKGPNPSGDSESPTAAEAKVSCLSSLVGY